MPPHWLKAVWFWCLWGCGTGYGTALGPTNLKRKCTSTSLDFLSRIWPQYDLLYIIRIWISILNSPCHPLYLIGDLPFMGKLLNLVSPFLFFFSFKNFELNLIYDQRSSWCILFEAQNLGQNLNVLAKLTAQLSFRNHNRFNMYSKQRSKQALNI